MNHNITLQNTNETIMHPSRSTKALLVGLTAAVMLSVLAFGWPLLVKAEPERLTELGRKLDRMGQSYQVPVVPPHLPGR